MSELSPELRIKYSISESINSGIVTPLINTNKTSHKSNFLFINIFVKLYNVHFKNIILKCLNNCHLCLEHSVKIYFFLFFNFNTTKFKFMFNSLYTNKKTKFWPHSYTVVWNTVKLAKQVWLCYRKSEEIHPSRQRLPKLSTDYWVWPLPNY